MIPFPARVITDTNLDTATGNLPLPKGTLIQVILVLGDISIANVETLNATGNLLTNTYRAILTPAFVRAVREVSDESVFALMDKAVKVKKKPRKPAKKPKHVR